MHIVLLLGSLTFLVNSMGRFPTNTVLASLSGFSSASLDFFFIFLAFFISSSSSSSLKTSKWHMKFNFCPQLENAQPNRCPQVSIQRLIFFSVGGLRITQFLLHTKVQVLLLLTLLVFPFSLLICSLEHKTIKPKTSKLCNLKGLKKNHYGA